MLFALRILANQVARLSLLTVRLRLAVWSVVRNEERNWAESALNH
jgi:hypothetical protein